MTSHHKYFKKHFKTTTTKKKGFYLILLCEYARIDEVSFFPLKKVPQHLPILSDSRKEKKNRYRWYYVQFCLASLCWELSNVTLKWFTLHLRLVYLFSIDIPWNNFSLQLLSFSVQRLYREKIVLKKELKESFF